MCLLLNRKAAGAPALVDGIQTAGIGGAEGISGAGSRCGT